MDLDPASESRSGSRRAKTDHKNRKKLRNFLFLKCWMFSFKGWRLLLLLESSLWRPRDKLQFSIKKISNSFYSWKHWINHLINQTTYVLHGEAWLTVRLGGRSRLGVDPGVMEGVTLGVTPGVVAVRLGTPCVMEPWNKKGHARKTFFYNLVLWKEWTEQNNILCTWGGYYVL